MAILSGRLRCGIPLLQRILRSEPPAFPQSPAAAGAFRNPSTATPEWLLPTSQLWEHSYHPYSALGQHKFSSSASAKPNEKESDQFVEGDTESAKGSNKSMSSGQKQGAGSSTESKPPESQSSKNRRRSSARRTQFSDSDSDLDLYSSDDLVKILARKEEQLKLKQMEIDNLQDKVLHTYAEMENVLDRTKREAENTKKFSIQNFAKNLLDVVDNLGRASSVVKDSFSKIDSANDTAGAVPLLKTLLEGVEMTEKQLGEVFRKSGVEKFDPTNEQFDPNRHHAVFQIPDPSKPSGTIASVLKPGYMLHDRVLRPAEVGVTESADN